MHATVDDVEGGHRQHKLGVTGEVSDVLVERDTLLTGTGAGDGEGDGEDGVGAESGFVGGTVELNHFSIDGFLVCGIHANDSRGDFVVDVGNGSEDSLAHVGAASCEKKKKKEKLSQRKKKIKKC